MSQAHAAHIDLVMIFGTARLIGIVTALTATACTAKPQETRIVESDAQFSCTPTAVWDGDGPIWCAEGPRVRLGGIAAREVNGTCRDNQPCPQATGIAARDALVSLLGGPRGRRAEGHIIVSGPKLQCASVGSAGGGRTAAWCQTPDGRELSCAMIATGTALRWPRYDRKNRCRR